MITLSHATFNIVSLSFTHSPTPLLNVEIKEFSFKSQNKVPTTQQLFSSSPSHQRRRNLTVCFSQNNNLDLVILQLPDFPHFLFWKIIGGYFTLLCSVKNTNSWWGIKCAIFTMICNFSKTIFQSKEVAFQCFIYLFWWMNHKVPVSCLHFHYRFAPQTACHCVWKSF